MSDNTTSSHAAEDLLMQLADGELHGEQRLRVDAHLQACARCQSRLAMIRSESEAIGKSLAPGEDDRNLAAAILSRIQTGRRRVYHRAVLAAAWAASVTIAFGLGYLARPSSRPQRQPEAPAKPAAPVVAELFDPTDLERLRVSLMQLANLPDPPNAIATRAALEELKPAETLQLVRRTQRRAEDLDAPRRVQRVLYNLELLLLQALCSAERFTPAAVAQLRLEISQMNLLSDLNAIAKQIRAGSAAELSCQPAADAEETANAT